ncbi:MAG: toll/interleukin-1 receptor domain-containing protein [Deltaproteobacteria bacterium]|nr:toll/interleukin-1 receptor domain-containing protein [Deltaproteobacteria bacterium]
MAERDFTYDVFLSYTEANKALARQLYERLRNQLCKVFFAEETMPPGANIPLGVMEALQESRKVAIIMTPTYFAKTWPRAEFATILSRDPENKERRLVPLLFETCEIPDLIFPLKSIDFCNPDDFDLRFKTLLEALDLPKKVFFNSYFPSSPSAACAGYWPSTP